jgi:hypothetical protein
MYLIMNPELPVIPEKLAQYVSPSDIVNNVQNYPEMQKELSIGQLLAVQAIKDSLMSIELTHSTNAPLQSILAKGIHPASYDERHLSENTFAFDRSLGLDEYVFMHWGEFNPYSHYGVRVIGVSPKELIHSSQMIATPMDVVRYSRDIDLTKSIVEHESHGARTTMDRYFSEIVRGQDWLEIVGRRVLERVIKDDLSYQKYGHLDYPHYDPVTVYKMHNKVHLGELKYYGTVHSENISSVTEEEEDFIDKMKYMIEEHGFAPEAVNWMASSGDWVERNQIDVSKPRTRWQDIIEMAKS